MWPAFDQALERFAELERLLADPQVIADRARYTQLAKEHGSLAKKVRPYQEFLKVNEDMGQAEGLLAAEKDPGMRSMIEEELAGLKPRRESLQVRLEDILLAGDEDFDRVIMEIRAGTGGDEAALFAGDLYDMYTHYARDQGWRVEDISFSPGEHGGFKEVVFGILGGGVSQALRYGRGGQPGP